MSPHLLPIVLTTLYASTILAYDTTTFTKTHTYGSGRTTETATRTELVIPPAIETLPPDVEVLIINYAPDVSSVDPSVATHLLSDIESFQTAYITEHTAPPVFSNALSALSAAASGSIPQSIERSLIELGLQEPWLATGTGTAARAVQSGLAAAEAALGPNSAAVSSVIAEYQSIARTYLPGLILGEASIVSDDLSVTATPPALLSDLSNELPGATPAATTTTGPAGSAASLTTSGSVTAAATSTSSSAGAAAAVETGFVGGRRMVLGNAVAVAAGMVALAVM